MYVKDILYRFLQSHQVHAVIQLKEKRQIRCGISPHHIGKIELQIRQRIDLPDCKIHRRPLLGLADKVLQLQHGGMGGQIIQSNGHPQPVIQICQQHHASQRIQSHGIHIRINAKTLMSQHCGYAVIDLLLQFIFRLADILKLFLFLFLLTEILIPDDLFRGSLGKRSLPQAEIQNPLKSRQILIMPFDDFGNNTLDICDTGHLGILEIGVYLRCHHIIFSKYQDLLDNPVIFKQILQLLRCHVFSVA